MLPTNLPTRGRIDFNVLQLSSYGPTQRSGIPWPMRGTTNLNSKTVICVSVASPTGLPTL